MRTVQLVVALAALFGSATAFTPVRSGAFTRAVAANGKMVNVVDVNDDYEGPDNEIVPLTAEEKAEATAMKAISPMQSSMKSPVAPECPKEFLNRKDKTPKDFDGLPEKVDMDKLLAVMCDSSLDVPQSLLDKRAALEAKKAGGGAGGPAAPAEAIEVTKAEIDAFKASPPSWFKTSFPDNELTGVEAFRELEAKLFTQLNKMQTAQQAEVDKLIAEIDNESVVFDEAAEIAIIQEKIDALDKGQIALASSLMSS